MAKVRKIECAYCSGSATTEVRASAVKKKGVPSLHVFHCDDAECVSRAKAALEEHGWLCA